MNIRDQSSPCLEWSDLDIEQYHDGEMEGLRRGALSEALLESPALRDRLGRVNRIDAVALEALSTPLAASSRRQRSVNFNPGALALAACLALAAVSAWLGFFAHSSGVPAHDRGGRTAADVGRAVREPASAVRVVLSIPMSSAPKDARAALDTAVSRGDMSGARAAFAAADTRTRDDFLRTQGDAIRSASRAEAFLDSLSAQDQLAACRVWSEDPRLRPAAFARLDRLRERSDIADQYRAVVTHLSSRPELGPWLRSYVRPSDQSRPKLQSS